MENKKHSPVFSDTDRALQRIHEEITAVTYLNDLYLKQKEAGIPPSKWRRPAGIRPTVAHTMFLGPAGCGKTTYANKVAHMMGLKEGVDFHKISADSFPTIADFIKFLQEKLNWEGYLCDKGHVSHTGESGCVNHRGIRKCKIVDPKLPRGPVPPVAIFIDEIHHLPKKLQDRLGVILLEFYYNLKTAQGIQTLYFPRFTLLAATTDIGLLSPALQTRFKLQIPVDYYSDEEMFEIVIKMCKDRGIDVEDEGKAVLARCAQGVPRNAENHIDQLLHHFVTGVVEKRLNHKNGVTCNIVKRFYDTAKYIPEGYSFNQIELLKYLAIGNISKEGKRLGLGITKICHRFGIDKLNFLHNWEPILQRRGLICTGTRGREITEKGLELLSKLSDNYPDKDWEVH